MKNIKSVLSVCLFAVAMTVMTNSAFAQFSVGNLIGGGVNAVGSGIKKVKTAHAEKKALTVADNKHRVVSEDGKSVLMPFNASNPAQEGELNFTTEDLATSEYYIPKDGKLVKVPKRPDAFKLPTFCATIENTVWKRGKVVKTAATAPSSTTVAASQ